MMNIEPNSPKLSYIDLQLNIIIFYIIITMLIFSGISTGLGVDWKNKNDVTDGKEVAYYIYPLLSNQSTLKYVLEVFQIFSAFFINYTNMLPISLMIIIEVVKPIQQVWIQEDEKLKEGEEQMKAISFKLQDNLGAVKYILSDKTGTLTKNEMVFHSCSIFGKLYEKERHNIGTNVNNEQNLVKKDMFYNNTYVRDLLLSDFSNHNPTNIVDPENPYRSISDVVNEYLIGLSLNHNVLPEIDHETGEKAYTGSSPDEVTLVATTKELGIEFIEKSGNTLTIKVNEKAIKYEILFQFEFTSERKRSSIIVKDPNGVIKLYMKGADDTILMKINDFSKVQLQTDTKGQIDKFAKQGLRTLCYTAKTLSPEVFDTWVKEYNEMKYRSISDKSLIVEVEKLVSSIEDESVLIGITGLEDKLQDEVESVINDFINAGISVWMLTGDKLDTAEIIGFSCKLFKDDTEVFKIRVGSVEKTLEDTKRILDEMEKLEKDLMNFQIKKSNYEKVQEVFKAEYNIINVIRKESEHIVKAEQEILSNPNFHQANAKGNPKHPSEGQTALNNENIMKKNSRSQVLALKPNSKSPENDIAIVKFIMNQKKKEEENQAKSLEDHAENEVSTYKNIVNDEVIDNVQHTEGKQILFDINIVYDKYQSQIHEIDEKKIGILNKMEIVDPKVKLKMKAKEKNSLLINFGLIIEGSSISNFVLPELQPYAWKLIEKCRSIICCRCNPLQKSEIVKFVKANTSEVTLSIGDGGNDVNMIKVILKNFNMIYRKLMWESEFLGRKVTKQYTTQIMQFPNLNT